MSVAGRNVGYLQAVRGRAGVRLGDVVLAVWIACERLLH